MTTILQDQNPPQSSRYFNFPTDNNLNTSENVPSWLFAAESKARLAQEKKGFGCQGALLI